MRIHIASALGLIVLALGCSAKPVPQPMGVLLETLTWVQAEKVLTPETVVVIPLGGASKEHGPHLPLNTDWLQAEWYKAQILQQAGVVVVPTITYSYYPAFLEYPGSVSIDERPARFTIEDICTSLARYGPKRFYVINMGNSTVIPLQNAANDLAKQGILLWSSRGVKITPGLEWVEHVEGSHANEVETSVMLAIAPQTVNMSKAVRDFDPNPGGGLTRNPKDTSQPYSPSGIWGDATKATAEKGRQYIQAELASMLHDIEELRQRPLP